jgi:hypothetical protein
VHHLEEGVLVEVEHTAGDAQDDVVPDVPPKLRALARVCQRIWTDQPTNQTSLVEQAQLVVIKGIAVGLITLWYDATNTNPTEERSN